MKTMIFLECLFLTMAPCDAAEPWQLGSQDAATPMMQGIIDLHHDIFFFLILIFFFVSWILVRIVCETYNISVHLALRFSIPTIHIVILIFYFSSCILTNVALCMDSGENEAEIYQRIRLIESNQYYNLPPQNAPGEYERLVREHFSQARNLNHFREILAQESFELRVLERKGLLQVQLFNLMLGEPKFEQIMALSPFTNVQTEAYHFIEDQVSAVSSLRHTFQRDIMDGTVNSFLIDLNQNGRNSSIYRSFYSHFVDQDFRRLHGLPLPSE